MRCHIAVNRVTLIDGEGSHTHRIDAHHDDGIISATLSDLNGSIPPKFIFAVRTQAHFVALARAFLVELVAMDRETITRYYRPKRTVLSIAKGKAA